MTKARSGGYKKSYSLNDNYFDNIDSEDKAYWIGFLSRDGSLSKSGIRLTLARKDRSHLEKLNQSLSSTKQILDFDNIRKGKSHPSSSLTLASPGVHKAFKALGIATLKNERKIPIVGEFTGHFWRGVWDADGTLCYKPSSKSWAFGFCGCERWVGAFIDYVSSNGAEKRKIQKGDGCHMVHWYGKDREIICHLLYDNATVYLDRKKKATEDFYQWLKEHLNTNLRPTFKGDSIPFYILDILDTPPSLEYESDGEIVRQWHGKETVTQSNLGVLVTGQTRKWYSQA